MRICFLAKELSLKDGWGRYSVSLLTEITKHNKDCCVLLSEDSEENLLPGIKNYSILPPLFTGRGKKLFSLFKNYKKIKKIINSYDMVHCLIEPYGFIPWLFGKKPFIVTLHGTYAVFPLKSFFSKLIYAKIYQSAKKLICVSSFTQKKVLEKVKLNNTVVINNGVDFERFQKKEYCKEGEEKIILSVGVIIHRKGYHVSIPAIVQVKKKYPNLKYYIIGSQKPGSYYGKLEKLIKRCGLENNVSFLRGISEEELIKMYHLADVFLLTPVTVAGSKFEGFGQVYLEANACGKPVIGTYDCGAEDAIKHNQTGFLIPQKDVKKTAQTVLKLLDNPDLARRLGENGREWARKMDWRKIAGEYMRIYQASS